MTRGDERRGEDAVLVNRGSRPSALARTPGGVRLRAQVERHLSAAGDGAVLEERVAVRGAIQGRALDVRSRRSPRANRERLSVLERDRRRRKERRADDV